MDVIQVIILGVVQGLGEFLPISSSAHLILFPWFFGWEDQGLTFDVALHFGTLMAVLWYFRRDWIEMFSNLWKNGFRNIQRSLLFYIAVATIPGLIAGYFLNDYAETVFRNPILIAITLAFVGYLLYFTDQKSSKKKSIAELTLQMALLIGIAQALAIIPGVSRSGITITAALLLGLKRQDSARFSFLLSTPIIFAASVYQLGDFVNGGFGAPEVIGILAAAISGYLAIAGLIKFVKNSSYKIFFWYRLILALIILITFITIG